MECVQEIPVVLLVLVIFVFATTLHGVGIQQGLNKFNVNVPLSPEVLPSETIRFVLFWYS